MSGWSTIVNTWRNYRGVHVITCPENHDFAAVKVDLLKPDLKLKTCSRWPEKKGCDEACLAQISSSPGACRLRSIVTTWYEGKSCHFCAKPVEQIVWHERPPAVLLLSGETREWKDIRPEELPKVFATADPVCWACHIVETFRHDYPERVIERRRIAEPQKAIPPSEAVY